MSSEPQSPGRWPLLLLLLLAGTAAAQTVLSTDEALALAFPKATVSRTTVTLDAGEQQRIGELAGAAFARATVFPYTATLDGKLVGTAYIDTHRVRGKSESLLVVVAVDGTVARVEVIAFAEPKEYLPRATWYESYRGVALHGDRTPAKVRGVTGATLTATATTAAVQRVLAVHAVLRQRVQPR